MNGWNAIFLPWNAHPGRTQEWYLKQRADILSRTVALDDLYQQYPATDQEALLPITLDRRVPYKNLLLCYKEEQPIEEPSTSLPRSLLRVFREPEYMKDYVIGIDPAEGNPTSDASVAQVVCAQTLEQVAVLEGTIEPDVLAEYCIKLSLWYNHAKFLTERNNHGHVVLKVLNDNEKVRDGVMVGLDGKAGWMSSTRGKSIMYDTFVEQVNSHTVLLHDEKTKDEVLSIEGSTLRAPDKDHDDHSVAFALAIVAATMAPARSFVMPYTEEKIGNDRRINAFIPRRAN